MTSSGDRFEAAYNKIDALLRKAVGGGKFLGFPLVVNEAAKNNATVRANREDLLEYGDLRNAIVHERGRAPIILADPRHEVVARIEGIWHQLSRPRTLRSVRIVTPIRVFDAAEPLTHALSYMREHEFSQVVVLRGDSHVILSAEGISLWLEAKAKEDIISLTDTRTGDVLRHEPRDTGIYLKVDETIDRAREVFVSDIGKRLFSALVTQNGKPREKPVNIITPWDIVSGALRREG